MSRCMLALFLGLALALWGPAPSAFAQKYGGIWQVALPGNPPSLSIHDEGTWYTSGPMQPVYNNLVYYDPLKPRESVQTIIPELTESWAWSADGKSIAFGLRAGVKFHDGKPFTSKDVKSTFDIARGVSTQRTKLNPRKAWWANISAIETEGDLAVTFRLKRPQPALVAMLASGYAPVMPAHRTPAEWRVGALGTGPFRFKEYQRDRFVELQRNPDYWVAGRPYLDGARYNVINSQASRIAAMIAQQVDVDIPSDTIKPVRDSIAAGSSTVVFVESPSTGHPPVHFNAKKAPFNDPQFRKVVSLAIDRRAFIKAILQGGAVVGGINVPAPTGAWGLDEAQLASVPGYGDLEQGRAEGRRIMTSLGYSADKPLSTVITTRIFRNYADVAAWMASQLREVWINAEVKLIETGVYYGVVARREFNMVIHPTGIGLDDPDVNYYENYSCGSQRNYSDYCNPAIQAKMDEQSQVTDFDKRLALVHEIDKELLADTARIVPAWFKYYNARQPYVRNYIPHQTNFNWGRLQEVWLDK
ncbi:MAG: ABC transporter substrate-binding protein [Candidatus Lambdaproteobacteria bacterium]|nr:ABC transporter substrate-binding protein [Candidatus Lambdaproteobacteria bacterium]